MTRRARDRAFASAFQVNVVFVGEGKNIVPFVSFDGFYQLPPRVLEMNFNPVGLVGFLVKRLQVLEAEGSGKDLPCSRLWPGHRSVSSRWVGRDQRPRQGNARNEERLTGRGVQHPPTRERKHIRTRNPRRSGHPQPWLQFRSALEGVEASL